MKNARLSYDAKPFMAKTSDKLVSILNTNTRSVCNQLLEDTKVAIACVIETWITKRNSTLIKNAIGRNYKSERTVRKTGNKDGGTLIFIREEYSVTCTPIKIDRAPNPEWLIFHSDGSFSKIDEK